jgi:hemerythrin superfamily protein
MIIKILNEQDFLDSFYGDWEFTEEGYKALYKHYNNTESNFIFNRVQILEEWDEYENMDLAIEANQFTLRDRDIKKCTIILEDYGRDGYILVKGFL